MQDNLNHPFRKTNLLLMGLLLLLLGCQHTSNTLNAQKDPFLQTLRDSMEALVMNENIPSIAIGIIQEGKVSFMEAFGWADKAAQVKATPQTIYGLGSMSKSICATGLMTLVEKGKISLEDPVSPLIAPLQMQGHAAPAEEVKVWHLANMSAGIPHGWTSYADGQLPSEHLGEQELFERYALITFPPGKVSHYANYSMGVADVVMEKVSGESLGNYMEQAVFSPLGMKNSLVFYQDKKEGQILAHPYNSRLESMDYYQFFPYGGGGYYASVEDLLQYAKFHLQIEDTQISSILSQENLDIMHHFDQGPGALFKLGWFNDGVKLISNGNISGYNSCLVLVPEAKMAVVVLTNMTSRASIADQIAFSLVDSLAPNLPEGMNREKYAKLYETPYQSNQELMGSWQGKIIIGKDTIPIQMQCQESIQLTIGNADPVDLEYPIYNSEQQLSGNFQSKIPVPEFTGNQPVNTWLNLFYDGEKLLGNAMCIINNERGSFAYGSYLELRRTKD